MSGTGLLSGGEPFSKKMLELPSDTILKLVDPVAGKVLQLQVVTAEKIFPWLEYGPDWRRDGDYWPGVYCVSSDKGWASGDVLLIVIDGVQFIFNKRSPMGTDGFKPFVPAGEAFGHHDSKNAFVTIEGMKYVVRKIGRWDVQPHLPGRGHLPSGDVARWLVAVTEDGAKAVLAEDFRPGSDHDSVWFGYEVDLDRIVKDVLTPTGD